MEEEKEQKVEQTEQPQETQNAPVEDNSKAVNQEQTEPNAENKKEEETKQEKKEEETKQEKKEKDEEDSDVEEDEEEEKKEQPINIDELESIEQEIEEMTKKVEQEKVSLRTYKERYEKAFNHYCELKGMPVPQTKEQKEKEREKHLKQIKKHKVADPIVHKKTKLAAALEVENKKARALNQNKISVDGLNHDINLLKLDNDTLKEELKNLRIDKTIALTQSQKLDEETKELNEKINEQKEKNQKNEGEIKHQEYKEAVEENKELNKNFEGKRDDMEAEYHKIIEESIKMERAKKKEAARKRQMNSLVSDSKSSFKGGNQQELQNYAKSLANEEISDRTPILAEVLKKWKQINEENAQMLNRYTKNADSIRRIFDDLKTFYGLDDYQEVAVVIKKGLDQLGDIQDYMTRLDNEIGDLKEEKKILQEKINFLSKKSEEDKFSEEEMKEHRKEFLRFLQEKINEVKGDSLSKDRLFQEIKPQTDHFIGKMNDTYMADYVPNRINVQPEIPYNYKDMEGIISGVEDYFKLIQLYSDTCKGKERKTEEMDGLRNEIKIALQSMDSHKLINSSLRNSMKQDYYKNGLALGEIIKKNSRMLCGNITRSYAVTEASPSEVKSILSGEEENEKRATFKKGTKRTLAPLEAA
ncbi:MAG: hypothetical protein MJ252_25410 [archaeon]|nr:hypothetical protein [archaeon]